MKMYILQTARLESGFEITPNWPLTEKITITSQFADMA